jgi:Ca-activated chloride channel homolog
MLAFDVSASMATPDLRLGGQATERLRVARSLADDFLERRQGDRVGLIVFGSQAYLHTPLTLDLQAVRAALATMETGFAGPETALGDAIGLATKHLTPLAANSRELVLLTDGANTAGTLAPQRAAWLAQRAGVRIHAIGIGAAPAGFDTGKPPDGLDEATLQQLATQSGGSYQRATDSAAIADFFRRLDQIRPTTQGTVAIRPQRALYPWPLGLALLLSVWLALRRTRQTTP